MRLIDADALEAVIEKYQKRRGEKILVSDVLAYIGIAPTLSPDEVRGVGCACCKEDRDGYTMPLEKNAHAWVQYPNKLVIQFGKEIRKCEIKYCPMCGARMKGAEDGTTDNS